MNTQQVGKHESGGEGRKVGSLDHHAVAAQIDRLFDLAAGIDHALARAGASSWYADSPRRVSLEVLEHVGALRHALDHAAVAAGIDPNRSPYVRRSLAPSATTRAAAFEAMAQTWPYGRQEHPRSRRAPASQEAAGPSQEGLGTGDGDRPASAYEPAPQGDSAAVELTSAASGAPERSSPTPDTLAAVRPLAAAL